MTKKQKIGVALIVVPPIAFVLNLVALGIGAFVLFGMEGEASGAALLTANVFRVVTSLVGIVSLIGTPVGLIAGIVLLATGGEPTPSGVAPTVPTGEPVVPPAPVEPPPAPPQPPVSPSV